MKARWIGSVVVGSLIAALSHAVVAQELKAPSNQETRGEHARRKTSHHSKPKAPVAANEPTALELQQNLEKVVQRLEKSEKKIEQLEGALKKERSRSEVVQSAVHEQSEEKLNQAVDALLAKYETMAAQAAAGTGGAMERKFVSGYDKGFFIKPAPGTEGIPFDILMNGRMQFRHTGFESDVDEALDRNDFEIERGRLIFSGHFIDPDLRYFINMDADTDDNHDVKFHDFYLTYSFSKAFEVVWGKSKVPGSRDWLESSQRSRFSDRSMATSFFRPDRTIGVWIQGKPSDRFYYQLLVGNGFATPDLVPSQIDDQFVFAGTTYWDLYGNFGQGYSDLEGHEEPAVRIGHSATYSDMDNTVSAGELVPFRLVDSGTPIVTAFPSAANGFDVWLYTVDLAMKYCGFSVNTEFFLHWLQDFDSGPLTEIFDYGFVAEAGYFVVPQTLELIARASRVNNDGGGPSADEYAGGVNWFIKGYDLRVTFDVSVLNGSPAQDSSLNIRAGDDGVLFRTQVEAAF